MAFDITKPVGEDFDLDHFGYENGNYPLGRRPRKSLRQIIAEHDAAVQKDCSELSGAMAKAVADLGAHAEKYRRYLDDLRAKREGGR